MLEQELGFSLAVPTYLPWEVEWLPNTHYVNDALRRTAYITFVPKGEPGAGRAIPIILELVEDPAESVECPLCEEPGFDRIELRGQPALASEGPSGRDTTAYTLYFVAGETFVTLSADWAMGDLPAGQLTDEQRDDVVRVAESMLSGE